MKDAVDLLSVFGGMPGAALAAAVVLAAFGLAAFAIYAVVAIAKEKR
jgi:hypothetical protein